jgi:hypothetical protein
MTTRGDAAADKDAAKGAASAAAVEVARNCRRVGPPGAGAPESGVEDAGPDRARRVSRVRRWKFRVRAAISRNNGD